MAYRPNQRQTTQQENIHNALLRGEKITPIDALHRWGSLRLAAIIHNLRKDGLDISTTIVKSRNRNFAEYKLESNPG